MQSSVGIGLSRTHRMLYRVFAAEALASFELRPQANAQLLRRQQYGEIQILQANERKQAGNGLESFHSPGDKWTQRVPDRIHLQIGR